MNESDIHKMYFHENHDHTNDHHSHRHEPHHHIISDEVPPTITADPPQLSARIRCHACGSECQSSQDNGAGGDGDRDGGGMAETQVLCGHCMLRLNGDDLDEISDADSLQGDEGLPRHQVEFPTSASDSDWIIVAGHHLPRSDIPDVFLSLAHYIATSYQRIGILPSPSPFTPALNSPMMAMASGVQTPSPTDSMIVERDSVPQSLTPSVYLGRVGSEQSLLGNMGAFEAAFPPCANFLTGPLWMGPEPSVGRRML